MELIHSMASSVFESRSTVLARGFTAKNYSIKLHDHDFYEVNIVVCGRGVHLIGDRDIPANIGDVFVIPPGVAHGYAGEGRDFAVYHLIAREEFFEKYSAELAAFSGFGLLFEVEPFLRERSGKAYLRLGHEALNFLHGTLELFESLKDDESAEGDMLRSSLALTVIGYLSRQATAARSDEYADGDEAIIKAIQYIHSNLSERITVDRLAEIAKTSRSGFNRGFKRLCAVPVHEYILERRLKAARDLISRGVSVTCAAQECGFYDASHLNKYLHKKRSICKP